MYLGKSKAKTTKGREENLLGMAFTATRYFLTPLFLTDILRYVNMSIGESGGWDEESFKYLQGTL
jgi:hypothetical protein